jgi:hypothetical protein
MAISCDACFLCDLCHPILSHKSKLTHVTFHEIQQVSVDVVNHFIGTDLPGLFSLALSSVPLGHLLAGEAINAILDPLEMMTRCAVRVIGIVIGISIAIVILCHYPL